jgi:hypothetical protein
MTHGLLPCMIGTQEVIILFSVLIPVVVIYELIRGFLKGNRQSRK